MLRAAGTGAYRGTVIERATRFAGWAAAVGLVAATVSCSSSGPVTVVTVTTTPTPPAAPGSASGTSSGPPGASGAGSASPPPLTRFPGTCDSLLPDYSVTQALGGGQLAGTDMFVVGRPEPNIGRLAYLNCRYGVTGSGASAKPKVEIGVSLYRSAGQARTRLTGTVDDYTSHGATATETQVGAVNGTLLRGGSGAGYTVPLLVAASGQRTVAVGVDPAVATGAKATADATALAQLALQRTGG